MGELEKQEGIDISGGRFLEFFEDLRGPFVGA